MSLGTQLSPVGLMAEWALAVCIWAVSVALGHRLLPGHHRNVSTLERIAVAGPWGVVFLVSVCALFLSAGTTMLTIVPPAQLALAGWHFRRRHSQSIAQDNTSSASSARPGWKAIALFFGAIVLAAQRIYMAGIMPNRGAGHWQMPFDDYTWWAMLSQQLAHTGNENMGVTTVVPAAGPAFHWYHWMELWLAGVSSRVLGLNALLVLLFTVYPMLIGMIALCVMALIARVVRWNRFSWLLGCGALVATTVVDLSLLPRVHLPPFDWIVPIVYYTNYVAAILFGACSILHLHDQRFPLAWLCMSIAILVAPPLMPLIVAALILFGLWRLAGGRGLHRSTDLITIVLPGLGSALVIGLWLAVSRHGLGPHEGALRSEITGIWSLWPSMTASAIADIGLAVILGLPYFWGLYALRAERPPTDAGSILPSVVDLTIACVLACFPVLLALRGNLAPDNDAPHILALMWVTFLVPLGWMGLSRYLLEGSGTQRWIAGLAVGVIVVSGVAGVADAFKGELSASEGTFSADEAKALGNACAGENVGYFSPEATRDREWWIPVESGWAVLSGCKFMRLNRRNADASGLQGHFWQASAPAAYADRQQIAWENTPSIVLGFADAHRIHLIAESEQHPVPASIRPYLDPWREAGPFTLYRVGRHLPPAASR